MVITNSSTGYLGLQRSSRNFDIWFGLFTGWYKLRYIIFWCFSHYKFPTGYSSDCE